MIDVTGSITLVRQRDGGCKICGDQRDRLRIIRGDQRDGE